jgi:hypothetical protein
MCFVQQFLALLFSLLLLLFASQEFYNQYFMLTRHVPLIWAMSTSCHCCLTRENILEWDYWSGYTLVRVYFFLPEMWPFRSIFEAIWNSSLIRSLEKVMIRQTLGAMLIKGKLDLKFMIGGPFGYWKILLRIQFIGCFYSNNSLLMVMAIFLIR